MLSTGQQMDEYVVPCIDSNASLSSASHLGGFGKDSIRREQLGGEIVQDASKFAP